MLPNSLVWRAYALRSARLWVGARAVTALVLANAELPPFPRSPGAGFLVVVIGTTLCFADLWRRRERVLTGNLGVSLWAFAGVSMGPQILCELGFVAALTLFA